MLAALTPLEDSTVLVVKVSLEMESCAHVSLCIKIIITFSCNDSVQLDILLHNLHSNYYNNIVVLLYLMIIVHMYVGVDECASRCRHRCVRNNHSFRCGCRPGFYLLPNLQDCDGINTLLAITVFLYKTMAIFF